MEYGINGIIAGGIATSVFYPLDTLKSRKDKRVLPLGSY
jgi:hypothetical protein